MQFISIIRFKYPHGPTRINYKLNKQGTYRWSEIIIFLKKNNNTITTNLPNSALWSATRVTGIFETNIIYVYTRSIVFLKILY